MQVTPLEWDTRQCDVHGLFAQKLLLFAGRDLFGSGAEGGFDLARGEIGGSADLLAFLRRELAYALLYLREFRGAAEEAYANLFEIGGGSTGGDGRECLGLQLFDTLSHRHSGRLC